jgi:hypothetical protein
MPNESSRERSRFHHPDAFLRAGAPDAIQRVLQLAEDRHRAQEQHRKSGDRGDGAALGLVGGLQQPLHRRGALVAHEAAQLVEDLAARRVAAEDQPGEADDDEQQRRDGKQRVVGERRSHAGRVVLRPGADRVLEERPDRPERRGEHAAPPAINRP